MSALDDFLAEVQEPVDARRAAPQHPNGWEPGVAWDGAGSGTLTTGPLHNAPTPTDWSELISSWDLDPTKVEVIEPVEYRSWDAAVGNGEVRRMRYYRARLRSKRADAVGIEELVRLVRRSRKTTQRAEQTGAAYVVALSDWQLGKKGTPVIVDRIVHAIDAAAARLKHLRRLHSIGTVALPCLGDLGEACDQFYDMQTFEVELDGREQARLGRRLVLYAVDTFRPLAERIVVPAVPGNHGEKRKDGKAFTTFADNVDLEIPEGVAEACAMNPAAYGHVSFVIPRDGRLTLTLELAGMIVGFAHGHQAKRGGTTPQQRVATWWSGQAFGQRPVGDARLLFTGHSHHESLVAHGPRWHIQAPAMDNGSQWWDETAGLPAPSGLLTVVVGPDRWHDMEVI
jgi:hypothetical protein